MDGRQANSTLYNLYRGVMLIALLFFLAALYMQFTGDRPPRWVELPQAVIFGLIGIDFVLFPEQQHSRGTRYVAAGFFIALGALALLTFIFHSKG